jgi:hypothetical protein
MMPEKPKPFCKVFQENSLKEKWEIQKIMGKPFVPNSMQLTKTE